MLNYNPVWYWVMSFVILGIIMLTFFFLLRLHTKDGLAENQPQPDMTNLLAETDRAFLLWSNRTITTEDACQRVSILIREHLHRKTGLPARNMTVTELEQAHAPAPVIHNIRYLYPILFGDRKISTDEEFMQFMNSSRAVIDGKWN